MTHDLDAVTRGGEVLNEQDVTTDLATLAERVTSLEIRRRELDEELKAVGRELSKLEGDMIGLMDSHGVELLRCNGISLFTRKVRFLKVSDPELMKQALRESNGWAYLVKDTYNANSLRSAVLEVLDTGGDLPSEIGSLVEVNETRTLSYRR